MGFIIRKTGRKAQIAIEFMMIVALAMVVILAFTGVLYYLSFNYSEEKNINRLRDLGYSLQNELILASEVEYGYERTIIIPEKIGTVAYSISQTTTDIVLRYKETELVFPIPAVTNSFSKGCNIVTKDINGNVTISSC